MGLKYDSVRKYEHSTLSDATERFARDSDAFTAGVQYALDTLMNRTAGVAVSLSSEYVEAVAAAILTNIHDGVL